jgi:pimeloyl-ACP methyl ester carboxylesterase
VPSATGYVDVNGCPLYYEVDGSGPPVLYFHGGFGGLGTGLAPEPPVFKDRIVEHNMFVFLHRRSAGRSGTSPGLHTLAQFGDDAEALLDHLGIDDAIIWGESGGVAIAGAFALERPSRTHALMLTDGAPWFTRDRGIEDRLRERLKILQEEGAEAAYVARKTHGTVGLQVFARGRRATDADKKSREAAKNQIQAQISSIPRDERIAKYAAELQTYAAYLDFDISDRLSEIRVPVLVAFGTSDSIFPNVDWPEYLHGLPNMTYYPVVGAEHGILDNGALADAILRFIARTTHVQFQPGEWHDG